MGSTGTCRLELGSEILVYFRTSVISSITYEKSQFSVLPVPAADVCSVEAGFRKGQRISSGAYMIYILRGVPKTDAP